MTNYTIRQKLCCLMFLIGGLFIMSPVSHANTTSKSIDELPLLIQTFSQDQGALNRRYSVSHSPEYFQRFDRFYSDWLNRLQEIDFNNLTHEGQVDFLMLQNHIRRASYFLQRDKERYESIVQWLPDMDAIMDFINDRRVGAKPDGQQLARSMSKWTQQVKSLRKQLQASDPLMKWEANAAHDALDDIRSALADANTFYEGYDIGYTWWVEKPYRELDNKLESYAEVIDNYFDAEAEQLDDSGIVGNPIGRDEIVRRLEFEMIAYTPQDLIDIAEHQFAKAEQEMLKASGELGYGEDWQKYAVLSPGIMTLCIRLPI